METAYKYVNDPSSIQLSKLTHEFRPAFSELVAFLKRIPFKMQLSDAIKEIDKAQTSNKEIKDRIKGIVSELFERTFTKVKLLEPQRVTENDKPLFYIGNLSGSEVVPAIIRKMKKLKSFTWDVNVVISNTMLSRVLKPEIWLHFKWEDEGEFSFCATLEQFQMIRKAIASILLRIHALENVKQIDL